MVHLYIYKHKILYLQEFVFSYDKATSSLKEYFHACEMDKTHIYVVFTYKAQGSKNPLVRSYLRVPQAAGQVNMISNVN